MARLDDKRSVFSSIFGRRRVSYGMIPPAEDLFELFESKTRSSTVAESQKSGPSIRDCFVPDEVEPWTLPQYQSVLSYLRNQTVHQDQNFYRRQSSESSQSSDSSQKDGVGDERTPFQSFRRWLAEVFHFFKISHPQTGEGDPLDEGAEFYWEDSDIIEGIPVDVCEKLKYVHIYY